MQIRKLFIYIVLTSILSSCVRAGGEDAYVPPSFRTEAKGTVEILGDELLYNYVSGIFSYGDVVGILAFDLATRTNVHFYDARKGTHLSDAIPQGRGPGEVVSISSASVRDGKLYVYDRASKTLLRYDLERMIAGSPDSFEEQLDLMTGNGTVSIQVLGEEEYLVIRNASFIPVPEGESEEARIELFGADAASYSEYPLSDRDQTWQLYQQPRVSLSPDGKHLAVAPSYGAILELFELGKTIDLRSCGYFIPAGISIKNHQLEYTDDTSYGFSSVTASDRVLYAGMVDPSRKEKDVEREGALRYPMLVSFDWKGKGLSRWEMDYSIHQLCLDEACTTLFVIASDSEGTNFLGKVSLQGRK